MQHTIIQINVGTIIVRSKFSAGQICLQRSTQHIATQSTYMIIETVMLCGPQSFVTAFVLYKRTIEISHYSPILLFQNNGASL